MPRPDDDTIKRMHHWFAVECNNASWDLSEKDSWTEQDERSFLAAAYASAFHWEQLGEKINRARADMLLAHTHAQLGEGRRALNYARAAVSVLETAPATDWDHAFAHLVHAFAAGVSGDRDLMGIEWDIAEAQGKKINDASDRAAFAAAMEKIRTTLEDF
jgi:hypothetical protein